MDQAARQRAQAILHGMHEKLDQLRRIDPYFIDASLREGAVGSSVGQTLEEKLSILPKLREFGFAHIILGSLDYAIADEPQVDDDFMRHLRDQGFDLTGCLAFTEMGAASEDGGFTPHPSQLKLRDYRIPNTLHEIYLSDIGMAGKYDFDALRRSLPASIRWLRENIIGDHGEGPRIFMNIVDGCDAFIDSPSRVMDVLELLAAEPIAGISIVDDRGTFLPFQVGAMVAAARCVLPRSVKVLVHAHAAGGFENASVIEALLNGADGVWGGLPKRAGLSGHASLGELIANLARAGNPHMRNYRLDTLTPLVSELQEAAGSVSDDSPIFGNNAYRLTLDFFRQRTDRFMDLPPEAIGARYRYRICPLASDSSVIAGRLAEITGQAADSFPSELTEQMIRLMRRDLRAGIRIDYDLPDQLLDLAARAKEAFREEVAPAPTTTIARALAQS